jgi:hypothetical protein
MPSNQISPKAGSAKMSTMAIVWGLAAGVAYLGLIKGAAASVYRAVGTSLSPSATDSGLSMLDSDLTKHFHIAVNSFSSLATVAIAAIPVAIIASIALGLAVRLRPTQGTFSSLLVVAGLLGIVGTGLLFVDLVANDSSHRSDIILAIGTIIVTAVLLRLQRVVRGFYQRTPAFATLIVGVVAVAYLFLANNTSIFGIVLQDVDVYLGLAAFALVVYAGAQTARHGLRLRRGK